MEETVIKPQHYLLTEDGVIFFFMGDEGFPEVTGEQPLLLDYVDEALCLVCGPYCLPLTEEMIRHFQSLAEKNMAANTGNGAACLVVGARIGFMEYRVVPLFDFSLGWAAVSRLVSFYELEQSKMEKEKSELEGTSYH